LKHFVTGQRFSTVMNEETVAIEVVFASLEKQEVIQIEVPSGTLIRDGVRLSCIESLFPSYDLLTLSLGVWGEVKPEAYVVQSGDRVEVYRLLINNAKDARRRRAETQANRKS
jgi:putative ubiquitin-RnfH superfamily antitoxin RatB of RatAB toxin-antitoxin module